MTTARMLPVGVIGLGAMGLRMACSILRAGHPVRGYDLRVEAMEELAGQGGAQSASAAEATRGAEIVLLVVVDAEQVEDVLFGSGKVAAALTRGAVVMVCSTVEPDYARRTGERLASMGIEMIDAPVSGGTGRASDGTLSIMASGPPAAFDKARPVMEAIGSKIYNLGRDCGQGSMMKTINQLLCGVHLAVSSEAMALGAKAGIDPHTLYEVICNSGGASFVFETHMIHVLEDDYTPRSAVDVFVKDLDIVLKTGRAMKFPLATAAAAQQLLLTASGAGFGQLDDAAVVKVFEKLFDFRVLKETRSPPAEPRKQRGSKGDS